MAGSTVDWKTTKIAYNPGQLWYDNAIPGAAARLTLFSDGTPDATANPSAKHAGGTKSGAKLMIKSALIKQNIDELRAPFSASVDTLEMGISAELVGVLDAVLRAFLLPGVATYATTASTFRETRIGITPLVYSSIAHIYPLIENTAKFGVFHIYSSLNDVGVEWAQSRKEVGFTPVSFVGFEISTRVATDTLGNAWEQIA